MLPASEMQLGVAVNPTRFEGCFIHAVAGTSLLVNAREQASLVVFEVP